MLCGMFSTEEAFINIAAKVLVKTVGLKDWEAHRDS